MAKDLMKQKSSHNSFQANLIQRIVTWAFNNSI